MINANLFCPLSPSPSIKMIKKEFILLIPVFDLFHLCLARCHLCWVWNPVENEEGPRIFLSTVLFEAPISSMNK